MSTSVRCAIEDERTNDKGTIVVRYFAVREKRVVRKRANTLYRSRSGSNELKSKIRSVLVEDRRVWFIVIIIRVVFTSNTTFVYIYSYRNGVNSFFVSDSNQ